MINLPETIPEFSIKHLIEWCRLPPRPEGRGSGGDECRLRPAREFARIGPGAPRRLATRTVSERLEFPPLRRVRATGVIEALTPLSLTTSTLSRDGGSAARGGAPAHLVPIGGDECHPLALSCGQGRIPGPPRLRGHRWITLGPGERPLLGPACKADAANGHSWGKSNNFARAPKLRNRAK